MNHNEFYDAWHGDEKYTKAKHTQLKWARIGTAFCAVMVSLVLVEILLFIAVPRIETLVGLAATSLVAIGTMRLVIN